MGWAAAAGGSGSKVTRGSWTAVLAGEGGSSTEDGELGSLMAGAASRRWARISEWRWRRGAKSRRVKLLKLPRTCSLKRALRAVDPVHFWEC